MCKEHLLCAAGVKNRQAGWPLGSCHTEILGFNRTFQVLPIEPFVCFLASPTLLLF